MGSEEENSTSFTEPEGTVPMGPSFLCPELTQTVCLGLTPVLGSEPQDGHRWWFPVICRVARTRFTPVPRKHTLSLRNGFVCIFPARRDVRVSLRDRAALGGHGQGTGTEGPGTLDSEFP